MRNIPSLEEFRTSIENQFMNLRPNLSKEEAMKYLYEEDYIDKCYERERAKYVTGEITLKQFMEGATATIAYQFFMEY